MSKDICKELRDVSRRSPSGISGCCLDAANEIEALRAENAALQHDIARHVQTCAEQAGEIERLTEALQIVASPLKINGDDHASAVKHARAALAAKE